MDFNFWQFSSAKKKQSDMATDSPALRKLPTIHHYSASMENLDSEIGSVEYASYMVHLPTTPDNQLEESMEMAKIPLNGNLQRKEDQFVSSSLFTGGHNCATHALAKEKVIKSEISHPQMAGSKGLLCAMPGCNANIMTDSQGVDILPCECEFKICRDYCYREGLENGNLVCPGCKEAYVGQDLSKKPLERRLSLMKSSESRLTKNQSNEFDYTCFLNEANKSYGYGNALWPKDADDGDNDGAGGEPKTFVEKQWKPLTRKLKISTANSEEGQK